MAYPDDLLLPSVCSCHILLHVQTVNHLANKGLHQVAGWRLRRLQHRHKNLKWLKDGGQLVTGEELVSGHGVVLEGAPIVTLNTIFRLIVLL